MNPNLDKAAVMAIETLRKHNMKENADPVDVLKSLPNVLLLSSKENMDYIDHLCEFLLVDRKQDAFTLSNRKDESVQYIIIYKSDLPTFAIRLALAKELGHVILQHDGTESKNVWAEESACFAYHFLCPLGLSKKRKPQFSYMKENVNMLWKLKGIQHFDGIEHLKMHIVAEENKRYRFIGENTIIDENDIVFVEREPIHALAGWKNCCDVVVAGRKVGFCGEH